LFLSWIQYLKGLDPDKIVLAEGGFRDFPLSTTLAAFVIARGNVWMMELHPAPEPTDENSGPRWGFISLKLRERARAWLTRGVLSVSQGVKDQLVQCYGYNPKKIRVVYNGVDTKRFSPASVNTRKALRKDLGIPAEAIVVVSAARLDRVKRLDRLIQAFGALTIEHSDLWLILTGDGPLRNELETLGRSVRNHEHIRFLGHVKDVCTTLRASDIYVLPSDDEGFGIALAEAMACELVCVSTRTIGPSEIIEDGVTGFLADVSYDGVLMGMDRALRLDRKEREAIGNRARRRVIEKFCAEESANKSLAFMSIQRPLQRAD
jgi:glycosyltransferase involved in cell wall biosynthesis